jgi:hypothetical protein
MTDKQKAKILDYILSGKGGKLDADLADTLTVKEVENIEKLAEESKEQKQTTQLGNGFLPNHLLQPLINQSVRYMQNGEDTQFIITWLMKSYGISYAIAAYINNEALSIVKMQTITEEEFNQIGQKYLSLLLPKMFDKPIDVMEENS